MKKILKMSLLLTVILVTFAACLSQPVIKMDEKVYPQAEPGKATLVIFRSMFLAQRELITFYVDGEFIGMTNGYSYIMTQLDPGEHYVMLEAEFDHIYKINVEAGKVYFAENNAIPGFIRINGSLKKETKEKFDKEFDGIDYYVVNPDFDDTYYDNWDDTMKEYVESKAEDPTHNDNLETIKGY